MPLVVLTVLLGVFPQGMLLSWMGPSVDDTARKVSSAQVLKVQTTSIPPMPAVKAITAARPVIAPKSSTLTPSADTGIGGL